MERKIRVSYKSYKLIDLNISIIFDNESIMRNFQKLDPISLKAFYFAAETLSFTLAANKAALTQSGISQHIARLEEELQINLFVRSPRKVHLTEAGKKLKAFVESYLDEVDLLLESITSETQELKGLVRYAMPGSCLMTPHFPLLLDARKKFSGVDLQLHICHSQEVLDLILNNEIDFGFTTEKFDSQEVEFKEFARENYVLVSSNPLDLKFENLENLRKKNFVNYPGMPTLINLWQKHYFAKSKRQLDVRDLKIAGTVNDLSAAITMVAHGVGLGIFPQHCVSPLLASKKLFSYIDHSKGAAENPIYIVQRPETRQTARTKHVIAAFWKMKN